MLWMISTLKFIHRTGRTTDAVYATTPRNLTVAAGTSVKFGCETDSESKIRWNFNSPHDQFPKILYSGQNVVSTVAWQVSVNKTARWNEITVRNVSTNNSGVYSCHEVKTFTRTVTFHLDVEGTSSSHIVSLTGFPGSFSLGKRCLIAPAGFRH